MTRYKITETKQGFEIMNVINYEVIKVTSTEREAEKFITEIERYCF